MIEAPGLRSAAQARQAAFDTLPPNLRDLVDNAPIGIDVFEVQRLWRSNGEAATLAMYQAGLKRAFGSERGL